MEKRKFRIGELANHLAVERFVIRFWEKEFDIEANRSTGGQRFYDEQDLQEFQAIKALLYEKKFTIAGAKQILKKSSKQSIEINEILASQITTLDETIQKEQELPKQLSKKLIDLRKQLLAIRDLL
jgi:DNA-binding transcriptional MerR regulator